MRMREFKRTWCDYLTPCPFRNRSNDPAGVMIGDHDCYTCEYFSSMGENFVNCLREYDMTAKQFIMDNIGNFSEHADLNSFVTVMRVPDDPLEIDANPKCITINGVPTYEEEEDFTTAQYMRNLDHYFNELGMKLTLRAAFHLLEFVKYPLGCRALAHITSYLTEEKLITLDVLLSTYGSVYPSFDLMAKWWDIYKEENKIA